MKLLASINAQHYKSNKSISITINRTRYYVALDSTSIPLFKRLIMPVYHWIYTNKRQTVNLWTTNQRITRFS